eukprot:15583028-Heterocapsa_arctica.AAC.1
MGVEEEPREHEGGEQRELEVDVNTGRREDLDGERSVGSSGSAALALGVGGDRPVGAGDAAEVLVLVDGIDEEVGARDLDNERAAGDRAPGVELGSSIVASVLQEALRLARPP